MPRTRHRLAEGSQRPDVPRDACHSVVGGWPADVPHRWHQRRLAAAAHVVRRTGQSAGRVTRAACLRAFLPLDQHGRVFGRPAAGRARARALTSVPGRVHDRERLSMEYRRNHVRVTRCLPVVWLRAGCRWTAPTPAAPAATEAAAQPYARAASSSPAPAGEKLSLPKSCFALACLTVSPVGQLWLFGQESTPRALAGAAPRGKTAPMVDCNLVTAFRNRRRSMESISSRIAADRMEAIREDHEAERPSTAQASRWAVDHSSIPRAPS